MSNKSISEQIQEFPEIIENSINMNVANSIIRIFEGKYIIKNEESEIEIEGTIDYEWFPIKGVTFSGEPAIGPGALLSLMSDKQTYKIIIDDLVSGEGFISETRSGKSNEKLFLKGRYSNNVLIGDRSIPVERLIFSVPNLREFYGDIVRKGGGTHMNRIVLESEKHTFILDKSLDYKDLKKSLNESGGYILQYSGQLTSKQGPILFKELGDIIHCFNTFLNFLNGRRTSALFISGFFENENKWTDYSHYSVDSYKYVNSWTVPFQSNFSAIWKKFNELWSEEDDKDFLISAIHWYVEANGNSGYIEGSIIMAQTALELLYNWWIIEDKKLILGKDSDNISASNKIRLLLSQLNVSASIPESFNHLKDLVGMDEVADAPDAIVLIRNAIVHSQKSKRKKLSKIHNNAKYEALTLSIWYIEMALLRILEYKGEYSNRCSSLKSMYVPWVKEEDKLVD